ncbi:MAG TPA: HAD family phosphatase [Candidatus Angelobacter sp.]|jgi:HAD superfamily hydrolase (TIGR01509 family)
MLAAIIVDFDGVIVDSHPLHMRAWKEFLCSAGRGVSDDDLLFVREGAKRDEILQRFMGDLTAEQIQQYGSEKEHLFQKLAGELKLVRGFAGFLAQAEVAGLPAAVATSGSRRRVEGTLRRFDLLTRFHTIVTGDDVPRGKPDPALFQRAAQGLRVDAENILVCEDAVAGVVAAKTAGMKCLAIATDGREAMLQAAGADLVVADFARVSLDDARRMFGASSSSRSAQAL